MSFVKDRAITGNITFKNFDNGSSYQLPINPDRWTNIDDSPVSLQGTPDGSPIMIFSSADQRERLFLWPDYGQDFPEWNDMLIVLRGYVGSKRLLHLGTIDYINDGWRIIRVLDVGTQVSQGGPMEYDLFLKYVFVGDF